MWSLTYLSQSPLFTCLTPFLRAFDSAEKPCSFSSGSKTMRVKSGSFPSLLQMQAASRRTAASESSFCFCVYDASHFCLYSSLNNTKTPAVLNKWINERTAPPTWHLVNLITVFSYPQRNSVVISGKRDLHHLISHQREWFRALILALLWSRVPTAPVASL